MLSKSEFNRLVRLMRRLFTWSDQYKAVMTKNRFAHRVHRCEGCERLICKNEDVYQTMLFSYPVFHVSEFSVERYAVDHINPVGTLSKTSLDEAANKIFCDVSNLMGLCETCHYFKTRVDLENIIEVKKSLLEKIELGEDI